MAISRTIRRGGRRGAVDRRQSARPPSSRQRKGVCAAATSAAKGVVTAHAQTTRSAREDGPEAFTTSRGQSRGRVPERLGRIDQSTAGPRGADLRVSTALDAASATDPIAAKCRRGEVRIRGKKGAWRLTRRIATSVRARPSRPMSEMRLRSVSHSTAPSESMVRVPDRR